MNTPRMLIVDDDADFRALFRAVVTEQGYSVLEADSAESALELLEKEDLTAIFLDVRLPGMDGLEFLRRSRARGQDVSVVILTSQSDVRSAVAATRLGAYDYLVKPLSLERMPIILSHLVEISSLKRRARDTTHAAAPPVIGTSPAMQRLLEDVGKIAPFDVSVLVEGETGSGKDVVAHQIHAQSLRARKPFLVVDCGVLQETLIASELFGHERGSFTGADEMRPGLFERAAGGTVFLDEIETLPLALQPRLLRILESREFMRVGGREVIRCDVRVIGATNQDLERQVEEGTFREDLYHRLSVIRLHVPPLRVRGGDIELLANYFIHKFSVEFNKPGCTLTPGALERLQTYAWPGNVRELAHTLQRAVLMRLGEIRDEDLRLVVETDRKGDNARRGTRLRMQAEDAEREAILDALRANRSNKSATARQLGVDIKTLYNKLKKYGIEFPVRT